MTHVWECRGPNGIIVQHIRRPHHEHPDDPTKKVVVWLPRLKEKGCTPADLLYMSPELGTLPDVPGDADTPVVITEGEKDADALAALQVTAIGTCTGADKKGRAPKAEVLAWAGLAGRLIVLWPDADDVGRIHMEAVGANLAELSPAPRIYIVDPTKLRLADTPKGKAKGVPTLGAGADDWLLEPNDDPLTVLRSAVSRWTPEPSLLDPPASAVDGDPPEDDVFQAGAGGRRPDVTVDDIVRAAGNLKRVGDQWQGPCPICGGTDRFHVNAEAGANGKPLMGCRKGGEGYGELLEALGLKGAAPAKRKRAKAPAAAVPPATKDDDPAKLPGGMRWDALRKALAGMQVDIRWNIRAGRFEATGPGTPGVWTAMTDRLESKLQERIADEFHYLVADGSPRDAVFSDPKWKRATQAHVAGEREVDPVALWLDSLPEWDGTVRLDSILAELWGCEGPLAEWASQYLVLAPVQRTRNPGCMLREIPVLIGGQGSGKSELVRSLCHDPEWFGDGLDFTEKSKERVEACLGKLVIEASEMVGVYRAEIESIKAFISRRDDDLRLAYARHGERRPRRFIIVGTANDTGQGILPNDPSGNARFVPVELPTDRALVGPVAPWVAERRAQWYAEALARHGAGLRANLPHELAGMQHEATEEHRRVDLAIEDRLASIELPAEFRLADIVRLLKETAEWGDRHAKRISTTLRGWGYQQHRSRSEGKAVRIWRR